MSNLFRALASKISEINRAQERWLTAYGHTDYGFTGETVGRVVGTAVWEPEIEVSELREGEIYIRVALPGVEHEEMDVTITPSTVLTVSGVSQSGAFRSSLMLPGGVDETDLRASLDNGVLRVSGCEDENPGHPRRIPVEPAGD